MINGLYSSASGMNVEMLKQEVLANNLANVNTTGFKKDEAVAQAFPSVLLHRIHDRNGQDTVLPFMVRANPSPVLGVVGHGAQIASSVTDFSQGTLTLTENKLDLAIVGDAFFTVELPDGTRAYTRSGNFSLNSEGKIVTQSGNLVLGRKGAPVTISGGDVVVDTQGRILVDGIETDTLLLTSAASSNDLVKRGDSLYTSQNEMGLSTEPKDLHSEVRQGYLEASNVSMIKEMVDMINVTRAYETNQKMIQIQDATLDKAVNSVGGGV